MRLEAHQVIHGALLVFLTQLHHCVRLLAHARIDQSHRLERPVAQRIVAAARHDLDRHAALKYRQILLGFAVKFLECRLLCRDKCPIKGVVLLARHGAIDIVCVSLIVAGGEKRNVHIDAFRIHDGRGSVEKVQSAAAKLVANIVGHGVAGQWARGNDRDTVVGQAIALGLDHLNIRMVADMIGNKLGKQHSVHSQRRSCGHARGVRRLHDQRIHGTHFLLEQANCIGGRIRAQRVGADQLAKGGCMVRGSILDRLHFVKSDLDPALSSLPCSLAACKSRSEDRNIFCHYASPSPVISFSVASLVYPQALSWQTMSALPFLRYSVPPQPGHFSAMGISQDEKSHVGYFSQL